MKFSEEQNQESRNATSVAGDDTHPGSDTRRMAALDGMPPELVPIMVKNLMQNATDMIYFKDLDSKFILASKSLSERLVGDPEADLRGRSDFDFFDAQCAEDFFASEQEIIRTGEPLTGKIESEVRNSIKTYVFTSKMPLKNGDGKIIGTFGISRDITHEQRVEADLHKAHLELVSASRRAGMEEIATNVIHNVGNVLNSINVSVSNSQTILSRFQPEKIGKLADLIEDNMDNPEFLSAEGKGLQVLSYLRQLVETHTSDGEELGKELESSRRHLDHVSEIVSRQQEYATNLHCFETVDIGELTNDAIRMSSSSLQQHDIEIIRDYESELVTEIDKHRVLQIIVNLIRNAKHACADSGKKRRQIRVACRCYSAQICVEIEDNGVGIPKENLNRLFNHGFTTRENGRGFGLHSCANSARQMGGSLAVASDGPGTGARFTLTLPRELNLETKPE